MPVLLLILLAGVLAYFIWRHRSSSLSRDCRWRQDRARGVWRCAACGGEIPGTGHGPPRLCLKNHS
ncbi:hypothetical protein [Antarcticimicrobium luteum]|uniref:Uncharacterized protein n=1 Tax=Antarcticimicrobium luteum TaxID=2547397 RepID=A0A4R5UT24_9RHOB|nr:hypothetical protein [Antarcticimicrobium luteum]TDK42280.1 hypothetical protein E1832_19265 [Antarcticimicrobium luteum]